MKKIIVGFSHSTKKFSPFSKGIQLWDGTNYSHVYFQFESSKYSIEMIYQASSSMLNYMSKDVFLMNNEVRKQFELQVTDEQYASLMQDCMKAAGLPYGTLQIVGIVVADVFKLNKNIFADDEKYHCSEWIAEQLEKLGYFFEKDLDLVKPSDVYWTLEHEIKS